MWALFMVLNDTHRLSPLLEGLRRQGVDDLSVMPTASYEAASIGKQWPWFSQVKRTARGVLHRGETAGFLFAFPLILVRGLISFEDEG